MPEMARGMAVKGWPSQACPMSDASLVGEARRVAAAMAIQAGLDEARRHDLAIVVSEMGQNIVRHARGLGEVIVRVLEEDGHTGVEVLGVDRGPGIANPAEALRDGYSTGGTPGTGLGAIARQSTEFDLYSAPGAGVVVLSRIWNGRRRPASALQVGAVCVAKPGETVCGDAWRLVSTRERTLALVVDGLGHGHAAAEAARTAVEIVTANARLELLRMADALHAGLRATRGAAIALAELRPAAGECRFVGIGNISAGLVTGSGSRSFVSHNGTAGVEARRIQELAYPWPPDALFVAHSDGVSASWDLARYPGLRQRDVSIVAAVLYRDFRRVRDDAAVLAVRAARESA